MAEGHRFRGRRALVQQRCIGYRQCGQFRDQGLEVQQGFQAALRYFGLVRRVLGVPGRILQDVPLNYGRCHTWMKSLPNVVLDGTVGLGQCLEPGQNGLFAQGCRQSQCGALTNRIGKCVMDKFIQRGNVQLLKHGSNFRVIRTNVAPAET